MGPGLLIYYEPIIICVCESADLKNKLIGVMVYF
jgi:hypothetical protein